MRRTLGTLLAYAFATVVVLLVRSGRRAGARRPDEERARPGPVAGDARAGARPARNRTRSARASAARAPEPPSPAAPAEEPDLSDDQLVARVRQRVAIPADVEVAAEGGAVVLFGRVARYLAQNLLARVAAVEGVRTIVDRLTRVDFVAPERAPGPPDPPP
jgi:hypothetical protein